MPSGAHELQKLHVRRHWSVAWKSSAAREVRDTAVPCDDGVKSSPTYCPPQRQTLEACSLVSAEGLSIVFIFYTCIEILKRNLCALGRSIVIHNYKNKHPIYYQAQCLGFVRLLPWFTALFYRARVLTSNGFVLLPLWKKGKPKPFAATCACLPVQVQSQACFLPIRHRRKATSWTRLSTLLLTTQQGDVWTYQRGEGDPSSSPVQDPGATGQTSPQLTQGCGEV